MFLKKKILTLVAFVAFTLFFAGSALAIIGALIPAEGLEVVGPNEDCVNLIVRGSEGETKKECPPVSEQGNYPIFYKDRMAREAMIPAQAEFDDEFRAEVRARLEEKDGL